MVYLMSNSRVFVCFFVVCISILFNTFAQQQYLSPTSSPSLSQSSSVTRSLAQQQQQSSPISEQKQYCVPPSAPSPHQDLDESKEGFRFSQPPYGSPSPSQFNQDDANNQQEDEELSLPNLELPRDSQNCSQEAVNQTETTLNVGSEIANQTVEQNYGSDIIEEFLNPQNELRRQYDLEPFSWDVKLETYAREWGCKRFLDCKMIHSFGPYGENLFWGFREHWTNGEAIQFWVNEGQFFDLEQNICEPQKVCGHFTQVVWKDSVSVGCARQKCNNGSLLVICEYYPPGNYVNEHPLKKNI